MYLDIPISPTQNTKTNFTKVHKQITPPPRHDSQLKQTIWR